MIRMQRLALMIGLMGVWLVGTGISSGGAANNPAKKIAIIPFAVPTEPAEREWLSEGLPRVLALRLQPLSQLKIAVLPNLPTSVQTTPSPALESVDVPSLLKQLRSQGYDVVVLGKFHQVETVLRAEVHLWQTQPEGHLGKTLEQSSEKDPDALGSRIATFLATAMQVNLAESEGKRVGERYTNSAAAFERFTIALTLSDADSAEHDVDRAVHAFREAFSLDGRFVVALRQLADLWFRTGDYANAAETYQAYLNQGKRSASVYRLLGNAYFAQRDVTRAVEAYRRGIQLDARDPQLYVDLGLAYAGGQDYENATKALLRALEVKPDDPLVFANLGVVYLRQGNFPAATSSLRRAQVLQGSNAALAYNLGLSLTLEAAYGPAREQFERALELHPRFTAAAYQLALLTERIDPHQASARWHRYVELATGRADEEAWLAYAQERLLRLQLP
jgi:Flp pilus assembly protein TadD